MEMLFVFLASLSLGWTAPGSPKSATKTKCTTREIQRQDCRLAVEHYTARLLPDTIARGDGTWRTVDDMPLKGDGTSWEKIELGLYKGWPILQLWIWDKAQGEAMVQQLHWYVADVRDKKQLHVLFEGVVRRRRMKQVDSIEGKPAPKPVYTLDQMEKHSLAVDKHGNLECSLGSEKRTLEKQPGGHHGI